MHELDSAHVRLLFCCPCDSNRELVDNEWFICCPTFAQCGPRQRGVHSTGPHWARSQRKPLCHIGFTHKLIYGIVIALDTLLILFLLLLLFTAVILIVVVVGADCVDVGDGNAQWNMTCLMSMTLVISPITASLC